MKKNGKVRRIFSGMPFFLLALFLCASVSHADPGNNYCIKPPFISAGRTPNLLMILDNSASMYDLTYTASTYAAPPTYSCQGTTTTTASYCFDNTFDTTRDYEGYFSKLVTAADGTISISYPNYQYAGGKFVEVTSIPTNTGTDIYQTSYLHIEMSGSSATSTRVVSAFYANGRFLNWLTASKFDVEKKILTGGKYDTGNQVLLGESRGCDGRRFVKAIPAISNITFAVRGPNAVEPQYNPSTQGGQTRIEIFEGTYNQTACQCAVYNWTSGNYGQASTDTGGCLGVTPSNNALSTLNHAQQTCWVIKQNINLGRKTDPDIWQGLNTQDIETACTNVYTDNKNPTPPSALTDKSSGNFICSSGITHIAPGANSGYDADGSDTSGYVGSCWQGGASKFTGNNTCVKREILHYCMGTNFGDVIDPSSGTTTATTGNIPSVLMDAGVRAIGNPIGPTGGAGTCSRRTPATACTTDSNCLNVCSNNANQTCTSNSNCGTGVCLPDSCDNPFYVKVGGAAEPTGLLQAFSSTIRFGAMTFNYAGSSSECGTNPLITCPKTCDGTVTGKICSSNSDCSSGSCTALTNHDGANILQNAYIGDPIGSHASGLVKAIDDIQATSWTPFAEAFYNAIAYFTHNAYATNNYLDSTKFGVQSDQIKDPLNGTGTGTTYDFQDNRNPIQYRCQLNNILLITDGASTADLNDAMKSKVTATSGYFRDPATTSELATCGSYSGSPYLHDLSYFAKHRNIFNPSVTCGSVCEGTTTACSTSADCSSGVACTNPCDTAQSITTYAVYTGPVSGSTTDMCDSYAQMYQTTANSNTALKTPANPAALRTDLKDTLQKIAAGAASGTAASILSNSEGSGANMLQAVFYPTKIFENQTSADWIGEMQNLWYYVDPYINNSTIREDTVSDKSLVLTDDYVTRFAFDSSLDKTMVQRYQDTNGDGTGDTYIDTVDPDYVRSLWRAGRLLFDRNISTGYSPRTIKTSLDGSSLIDFSATNATTLAPYLNVTTGVAPNLISWVQGTDQTGYRNRTVDIKNADNTISHGTWRLGDIITSTPRVQSSVRLNTYSLPPPGGYSDKTYDAFVNTSSYLNRGMVYVGGNDGMFHAFNLGQLTVSASGTSKATLTGSDLGKEMWAFIPKNALPYLQYMADPLYSHLYAVDGRTVLFDASIGDDGSGTDYWSQVKTQNSWRTVVIGGMGIGGATKNNNDSTCTEGAAGTCVKTPISNVGYSSYFALDVTNPNNPTLLWELSPTTNSDLGFASGGPAIVRLGDKAKNGHWYAVFGSGPTGPIDTATDSHQFLAKSDQNLKLFVVDLASGTTTVIDTGIANAFVGTMLGASIDADRSNTTTSGNYQDDALYVGYVKKATDGTWTQGGVGRLMTKEIDNPASWQWSTVIDDIGPVTSAIARSQDKKNKNLWLYFGTGRFYYRTVSQLDDKSSLRMLYGIKEPCYNTANKPGNYLDGNCTTSVLAADSQYSGSLVNQTSSVSTTLSASAKGWYIGLDAATTTEGAERVVTDTVALTNGTVFFTSFKPTMDLCGYGGNSYLWGVKYDTGGQADANALQGKALIQMSTGEFKEVNLATAFTDKNNRRMLSPMTGKPPSDAPPIVSNSMNKPVKKILHIQEH
jgi:type IV pilus assembly protein PilY1